MGLDATDHGLHGGAAPELAFDVDRIDFAAGEFFSGGEVAKSLSRRRPGPIVTLSWG